MWRGSRCSRVEEKIAENSKVEHIDSTSRTGITVITVQLQEGVKEPGKEFDDIKLKLDSLTNMPQGVQPLQFLKDFGDTTALMLTVASPRAGDVEVQLRAQQITKGIQDVRTKARPLGDKAKRASLIYSFPATVDPRPLRRVLEHLATFAEERSARRTFASSRARASTASMPRPRRARRRSRTARSSS